VCKNLVLKHTGVSKVIESVVRPPGLESGTCGLRDNRNLSGCPSGPLVPWNQSFVSVGYVSVRLVVYVLSNQMSLVDKVETGSWIF